MTTTASRTKSDTDHIVHHLGNSLLQPQQLPIASSTSVWNGAQQPPRTSTSIGSRMGRRQRIIPKTVDDPQQTLLQQHLARHCPPRSPTPSSTTPFSSSTAAAGDATLNICRCHHQPSQPPRAKAECPVSTPGAVIVECSHWNRSHRHLDLIFGPFEGLNKDKFGLRQGCDYWPFWGV